MANIYRQSFDYNTNVAQIFDATSSNVPVVVNAAARTGPNGLRVTSPASAGEWVQKNLTSVAEIFLGCGVRVNTTSSTSNVSLFQFIDGSTVQVTVFVTPTGQIAVFRGGFTGGTLLGTSSSSISFSAYHEIELHLKISTTTGVVVVRVDGTTVLSLSGQNTQSTGNATFNGFLIGNTVSTSNVSIDFDDVVMNDTTGSFNNTFTGIAQILCNLPNSNGTLNNWTSAFATFLNNHGYVVGETFSDGTNIQRCTVPGTSQASGTPTWATTGGSTTTSGGATFAVVGTGSNPGIQNWMAVSEVPPDDASSQNTDATVNDTDRYKFASIAAATVLAVCVTARLNLNTTGTRSIRLVVENGGTTVDNGADLPLTTSEQYVSAAFDTDPNTGVAWTASGVNTAEAGVKVTV